ITGCGRPSTAPNAARNTGRCASSSASLIAARSFRSAPTQNARSPTAASSTARTSRSAAISAQTRASRAAMAVLSAFMASGRSSTTSQIAAEISVTSWRCTRTPPTGSTPCRLAWTGRARASALFAGQPGLLILDQLEQRGLHLGHARDLGEDQLAVLARRLHHQPSAAEQPVQQAVRERDVADPDQREVAAFPGQYSLAQPEAARGQLVAGRRPPQQRDDEPDHRRGQGNSPYPQPDDRRMSAHVRHGEDQQRERRGDDHRLDTDGPQQGLPVRVQLQDEALALGQGGFTGHRPHRGTYDANARVCHTLPDVYDVTRANRNRPVS